RLLRMMSNSLLLDLMLYVLMKTPKGSRNTIPDQRVDLYERFVDQFIERRLGLRSEQAPVLAALHLEKNDQKSYLYAIGYMLHRNHLWYALEQSIVSTMRTVRPDATMSAIEDHLKYLVDDPGIIQPRARNCYAFSHLAFQEFAAAR